MSNSKFLNTLPVINENLLINSYFVNPVNMLGLTEYKNSNSITINQWRLHNTEKKESVMFLEEDGIRLIGNTQFNTFLVYQYYKEQLARIKGRRVAWSIFYKSNKGFAMGVYVNGNFQNVNIKREDNLWYTTIDIPEDTEKLTLQIGNTTLDPAEAKIIAMKLEFGDKQTLVDRNEAGEWELLSIPDFNEEYKKCLRYMLVSAFGGKMFWKYKNEQFNVFIKTPVPMTKAMTFNGTLDVYTDDLVSALTSIKVTGMSVYDNGIYVHVNMPITNPTVELDLSTVSFVTPSANSYFLSPIE